MTRAASIRFSSSSSRSTSVGRDEPALARLAQPVELLALVARGGLLGLAQRLELLAAEEVGVALRRSPPARRSPSRRRARRALPRSARTGSARAALELGRGADGGDAQGSGHVNRPPSRLAASTRARRLERLRQHLGRAAAVLRRPAVPLKSTTGIAAGAAARRAASLGVLVPRCTSSNTSAGRSAATAARASCERAASRTRKPSSSRLTRQSRRSDGIVLDDQDQRSLRPPRRRDRNRSRLPLGCAPWRRGPGPGSAYADAGRRALERPRARRCTRLEAIAAEPERLEDETRSSVLRRLQYAAALRRASTPSASRRPRAPSPRTPSSRPRSPARATRPARSPRRSTSGGARGAPSRSSASGGARSSASGSRGCGSPGPRRVGPATTPDAPRSLKAPLAALGARRSPASATFVAGATVRAVAALGRRDDRRALAFCLPAVTRRLASFPSRCAPRTPQVARSEGSSASSRPRPTLQFRLRAWRAFQRALDPLAPPRPLPPAPAA